MSIVDPLACGFAKAAAYKVLKEDHKTKKKKNETVNGFKGRILSLQFEKFNEYFNDNKENFNVTYKQFTNRFPLIIKNITNLNKRHKTESDKLFKIFSKENWLKLEENKKAAHSLKMKH